MTIVKVQCVGALQDEGFPYAIFLALFFTLSFLFHNTNLPCLSLLHSSMVKKNRLLWCPACSCYVLAIVSYICTVISFSNVTCLISPSYISAQSSCLHTIHCTIYLAFKTKDASSLECGVVIFMCFCAFCWHFIDLLDNTFVVQK